MRILPAFMEIETADADRFEQVSLHEQVGRLEDSLREPLAQYLDGSTVLMSAGNVTDPLDADKGLIVPFGFSTDGDWAWPTYWAYFVREYGALVSHDFLEHVHSRAFTPTELNDEEAQEAAGGIQQLLYG